MDAGLLNVGLAFLEGVGLILSPCILPVLPIILSGSLTGNITRPLGIITGFIIIFTFVTLFSRLIILFFHIDPMLLRQLSFAILFLLGIVMVSSYLTDKFSLITQRLSGIGSHTASATQNQGGFMGGFIFGSLIGFVWTPCAGPILAAVIVQTVVQSTTISSLFVVIAFALGAGVPMLLIAFLGRNIMKRMRFFQEHATLIRKLLGMLLIVGVIMMMYYPSLTLSFAQKNVSTTNGSSLLNGLENPYPAPQLDDHSEWINSPPLKINQLKGKVVLIDFWTYSCINCIRTLPYLKDWYAKYHQNGLVIIGVHSPEFEFEKDINNVKRAVKADNILYPVTLDNQYITWNNFHNQYWPAHYLIDKNGQVVYEHFGEGEYDVTENNIRYLLGLQGEAKTTMTTENFSMFETPETYLGFARAAGYAGKEAIVENQRATYHYPDALDTNTWALNGDWIVYADKIVSAKAGAAIKLRFFSSNVYAVMGSAAKPVTVKLMLNGEKILDEQGKDVKASAVNVSQHRLYTLVTLKHEGEGVLEMQAMSPGLELFTFTFGG